MSLFGLAERTRARFFDDLATSLDSGLPIVKALGLAGGSSRLREAARRAAEDVRGGEPLSEAFADTQALTPLELAVLEAGEQGGQLPALLRRLCARHEARAKQFEAMHTKLAYPLLLVHLAVLLPSLVVFIQNGVEAYAYAVLPPILIGWGSYFGLRLLLTFLRSTGLARPIDRFLVSIPLLGSVVKEQASSDFAATLSLLLQAGVPIVTALERAARTTENRAIQAVHLQLPDEIQSGESTLADALSTRASIYPKLLIESTRVGEASGKLDEMLERTATNLLDRASGATNRAIAVMGTLAFLLAAFYVASVIIGTYSKIYSDIGSI